MRIVVICLSLTLLAAVPAGLLRVQDIFAQQASPSATPSEEVQQNLRNRIEQVIEERQVTQEQRRRRALVGIIEKINAEAITIRTLNGIQTAKLLPDQTVMLSFPELDPITLPEVQINGFAIAMGYLDDDDVLDVRRLLVSSDSLFPLPKKVLIGEVQTITPTALTLITRQETEEMVLLGRSTTYEDVDEKTIARTAIDENSEVLVIATDPEDASPSARLVRVLREAPEE